MRKQCAASNCLALNGTVMMNPRRICRLDAPRLRHEKKMSRTSGVINNCIVVPIIPPSNCPPFPFSTCGNYGTAVECMIRRRLARLQIEECAECPMVGETKTEACEEGHQAGYAGKTRMSSTCAVYATKVFNDCGTSRSGTTGTQGQTDGGNLGR